MILSTIVEISSPYFNGNYEVQGTSKKRMIYFGDQLVATVEDNAGTITPHYTHTDHLNGASVVTNTSGTQDELIDYYAFGEQRVDSFTTFKEKRKYTGHLHDDDTGLEYVKARYLNSGYNRFISQDKVFQEIGNSDRIKELSGQELSSILRDPQQLNSYSYARNNPYKYIDPNGNAPTQSQAVGLNEAVGFINNLSQGYSSSKIGNYSALFHTASTYKKDITSADPRYVYSKDAGWVDLRHFFGAAKSSAIRGDKFTRLFGFGLEIVQGIRGQESSFSYEDLSSNLLGTQFQSYLNNYENKNASFSEVFSGFLEQLNVVDPEEAPNYDNLSKSESGDEKSGSSSYKK